MAHSLSNPTVSKSKNKFSKTGGKLWESLPAHIFGCNAGWLKICSEYVDQILTLKK